MSKFCEKSCESCEKRNIKISFITTDAVSCKIGWGWVNKNTGATDLLFFMTESCLFIWPSLIFSKLFFWHIWDRKEKKEKKRNLTENKIHSFALFCDSRCDCKPWVNQQQLCPYLGGLKEYRSCLLTIVDSHLLWVDSAFICGHFEKREEINVESSMETDVDDIFRVW